MVKDFHFNVVYEGKTKIIQCPPIEFLNVVAKSCNIKLSDIDLYAVEKNSRRKISSQDLTDLMKIEIVLRDVSANMNNQRSLRSYFEGESSKDQSLVERIMTKLKSNSALNGLERKYLMDMLEENCSTSPPAKRKCQEGDMNGHLKCKMVNKKVQARPSSQLSKDSFAQTDADFSMPDKVNAEREETLSKIKKLATHQEIDSNEVKSLMQASFDDRRNFILLKAPLVVSVRDKYPLLFSVNEVRNELDRLFYMGKCKDFMDSVDLYSGIILDACDSSNEFYQRTIKCMERCHTLEQKKYARAIGSILVLPSLVNERLGFVNTVDNSGKSDVYPYIDASVHNLKEIYFDNMLFKIITEEQLLCEACNFKEAILCIMASFYIFNIDYTQGCEKTLTIFEKLYLSANETHDIDNHTEQLIKLFKLKAKN